LEGRVPPRPFGLAVSSGRDGTRPSRPYSPLLSLGALATLVALLALGTLAPATLALAAQAALAQLGQIHHVSSLAFFVRLFGFHRLDLAGFDLLINQRHDLFFKGIAVLLRLPARSHVFHQ